MAVCSDSVLTGQEGLIQFKPPGTTVCVSDYTAFYPNPDDIPGTDTNDCIVVGCEADFRVGDCVIFSEENGATAPDGIDVGTAAGALTAAHWAPSLLVVATSQPKLHQCSSLRR